MSVMASPPATRSVERPAVVLPAQRQELDPLSGRATASRLEFVPALADSVALAGPEPVTTMAQAAAVALHRTRRFTLLGQVPVVGILVVPWLWPLHLWIVGRTAGHIRLTADASLSFYDGARPRRHRPAGFFAVLTFGLWCGLLYVTFTVLISGGQITDVWLLAAVVGGPPLIELASLIEFAVLNPEWLTLKRVGRGRTDGRPTYVLTSLVSRRDGGDFAGKLMAQTFPQWHAADAVVIGYPAAKNLISYYVRMGARRDCARDDGRAARRRVTFDCRQPLRPRHR